MKPDQRFHLFVPFDDSGLSASSSYDAWPAINEVMSINVTGVVTARDHFVVEFDRRTLRGRIVDLRSDSLSDDAIRERYFAGKGSKNYPPGDSRGWKLPAARKKVREDDLWDERYAPVLYRPFDTREFYNVPWMVDWPRTDVMGHMLAGENIALIFMRQVAMGEAYTHFGASRYPVDNRTFYSSEGIVSFGPLYLYPRVDNTKQSLFSRWPEGRDGRRPNLDPVFVERLAQANGLRFVPDGRGDLRVTFGPEDVLACIYSVFHSPGYRECYDPHLKLDFPRVPMPGDFVVFRDLVIAGHDLLLLHLFDSPKLDHPRTDYAGPKAPTVGRVGWANGTVWLDAAKTNARQRHRAIKPGQYGFHGVPEEVWDFHIGGYQVCHKWLKDREGRRLSDDDIAHYQKIVVALNETIRIMAEIDEVIEAYGGWPGAFRTRSEAAQPTESTARVVPFRPRMVQPKPEDRYVTSVPLIPLKAAAGGFSGQQFVEDDAELEWVEVQSRHRLRPGMFVAQVVGRSMEPSIPDGSWCLFRGPVEGTRQGKTVLVQLRDTLDPETGQHYTVKRYRSEKVRGESSWRHEKIILEPLNLEFGPIELRAADATALQVVAEFVEVLEG